MEERTSKQVIRAWVILGCSLLVWYLSAEGLLYIEGRSFKDSESDLLTIWGVLGLVALPLMLFVSLLITVIWVVERFSRFMRKTVLPKQEP
jgi:hypothetical protein